MLVTETFISFAEVRCSFNLFPDKTKIHAYESPSPFGQKIDSILISCWTQKSLCLELIMSVYRSRYQMEPKTLNNKFIIKFIKNKGVGFIALSI